MSYFIDFDFLGKDSVPFKKTVEIDEEAFSLLQDLVNGKSKTDEIFDVSSADVNSFIKEVMHNASAKLFRTAVGSKVATDALIKQKIDKNASVEEKVKAFNEASLEISSLLNHQKNVSKGFNDQMKKADDKLSDLKKKAKDTEKKAKEDLKKIKKQIEATKAVFKGEELQEKLAKLAEKKAKIETRVEKSKNRVSNAEDKIEFKQKSANIALGTAKGNYFDPRVVVSWAKHYDVPIEKLYTKSLINKFQWAMDVDEDFFLRYGKSNKGAK